ncbi:MAG: DNA polymerase III subunit chi [Aquabacterium sp.]|mgnify:CR=1 FL=1|jgi:DNA polymerase-3 subunit chi|uniref:DNA polymerase III subunit chi n=1 Tax=Aquabacterium sp. TaxID=1872578 RepID=UPI001B41FEF0|nr:DNA polymerase III subunit chi [Aquabacterium sp.]MBP7131731.1 DNA polymerase III subunit chi [Aquabacterium sp.]MBP9062766.1 DNA polymerase III subunit chi [Aquabacterium sp.]MDQ5926900.1 polymerase subunit chi [Pseudomonadota bacterium]
MSTVEFHHGMPDKLAYACRLLRKAYRTGARVVVTGDAAALKSLDHQLWTFEMCAFVPHVLAQSEGSVPTRQHDTPIWLTTDPATAPGERSVLVNIGQTVPVACERFARLFEIVSNDAFDRQQGRLRWKTYTAKGWQVNPHEVKE